MPGDVKGDVGKRVTARGREEENITRCSDERDGGARKLGTCN